MKIAKIAEWLGRSAFVLLVMLPWIVIFWGPGALLATIAMACIVVAINMKHEGAKRDDKRTP